MESSTVSKIIDRATRAPSSHNTQPWLFRVGNSIELHADRARALPVNDPEDRELTISCGAALFNLRVAAADLGFVAQVDLRPDPTRPDLLARIRLAPGSADEALAPLAAAVAERHTIRDSFDDVPLPEGLHGDLVSAAAAEGAQLHFIQDKDRAEIASLVGEGDRLQFGNPRWRRELAHWLRVRRSGDGLTVPAAAAPLSRLVVRTFDLGARISAKDEALARQAPVVAVLTTVGDAPDDWLRAGQALERALLVAASHGVQAGYLNQPCQNRSLRPRVAEVARIEGVAQLILRFGFPRKSATATPRRALDDVLLKQ